MLNQLDHLPDGLLDLEATELHDVLGGPTLIYIPGRQSPPLFVSVLMHGNETTGWYAVRQVLRDFSKANAELSLPRAMMLFIGNTRAAKHNVRHLPDQPDFNRVWPGSELPLTPEHSLMQRVVNIVRAEGVFASVDVHNNTGLNPHYACVNTLAPGNMHLATLFGRTVVYFTRPKGVQSRAMSDLCPAVTLECGRVGNTYATEHTRAFIDACLHLSELPTHKVAPHDIDLFHTTAIVKVNPDRKFGYQGDDLDLQLEAELDHYNFRELASGTRFGSVRDGTSKPLAVSNEHGEDVYDQYFETVDGELRTRLAVMPSMLTQDVEVIRQDCLCYLMERYRAP